ncbi:hypothetical protein ACFX13_007102 [Malus domestica]
MAVDSVTSSLLGPPATEKDAKALQFIEETTKNTDLEQERVLLEILSRNVDTEYLKRFSLDALTLSLSISLGKVLSPTMELERLVKAMVDEDDYRLKTADEAIRALSSLKNLKSKKELMANPVVLATGEDGDGCITVDELATVIRSLD